LIYSLAALDVAGPCLTLRRSATCQISIEDPFELTHDLGNVCDRTALHEIRGEFMRAHRLLCDSGDWNEVCDAYTEEWRGS
jgi:hypothetical protein